MIGFEPEMVICFDRILTRILKLIGEEFIHESDPSAFLQLINENADTAVGNFSEGKMELVAAVTTAGAEDIAGQALRVDAQKHRIIARDVSHHQCDDAFRLVRGLKTKK